MLRSGFRAVPPGKSRRPALAWSKRFGKGIAPISLGALFFAIGGILGELVLASENDAFACSCVEEAFVDGEFVDLRRVAGTGDLALQAWWQAKISIDAENESIGGLVTFAEHDALGTELELVRDSSR